jgi:hypothetical protein
MALQGTAGSMPVKNGAGARVCWGRGPVEELGIFNRLQAAQFAFPPGGAKH